MKKRIIHIACFILILATTFSGISFAGTWVKTGQLWGYRVKNQFYRNQWAELDGEWYYFKSNGYMASKEWVKDQENWYYFLPNGVMTRNQWVGDYYLLGDGTMAKNQEIEGKYLGEDGKRDIEKEKALAEAALQAKIQDAKNKGYEVLQGRFSVWTETEWANKMGYQNDNRKYALNKDSKYRYFGVFDFIKPERLWIEPADGDPSYYDMVDGVDFYMNNERRLKFNRYAGKTVYMVFEKTFGRKSDYGTPIEYDIGGGPLYVIE